GNAARVGVAVNDDLTTDRLTIGELILSGPSNFLIEGDGQSAELAVGFGPGANGSVYILSTEDGGASLTLRGTTARAVVATSGDGTGYVQVSGADSALSISGTTATLAIGTGDTPFLDEGIPFTAGVVLINNGASLVVEGTSAGSIDVGAGQNGGELIIDNANASVVGDLNIASTPAAAVTGNGRVTIGNAGVMTVTDTTRVFDGGFLGGFDSAASPVSVAAVGGEGILRTAILELYAGGAIDIDNLAIEGLQEFRLFEGATVSSSLEAFIGDNVSRVKAQGATIALGNALGVGTTSANAGLLDLASGSSADIDGSVSVGGELGSGRINVVTGSTLRVRSAASGPGALGVGSAGALTVAGAESRVELDGRLIVDGGEVSLGSGAGFAVRGLDLANGRVEANGATGSILGTTIVGGGAGTSAIFQLGDGSSVTAEGDVQIGLDAGTALLDVSGSTLSVFSQTEISPTLDLGSTGTARIGDAGTLDIDGDINLAGGLLNVNGSGQVLARNLIANAGGRVTGNGRLALSGALQLGTGSTLSPGNSPGLLTIDGDLTIDGGTILIEMAGADPGQYDVLRVEGDLAFNSGAFNVSLLDGFSPAGNSEFRVLEARDTLTVNTGAVTFGYVGMGPDYTFSIRDYTETIGSVTDTYQGGFITFVAQDIAPTPGLTTNEAALAETLDELCPRVEGIADPTQDEADLDRICGGLRNGSNSEEDVQAALEALSPEEVANTLNTVLRFTTVQHGNLSQRINGLRYGVKPIDFSGVNLQFDQHFIAGRDIERALEGLIGGAASADEDFARWGFFGNAAMNRGDKDATSNDAGFDFDGTVLSFGADYRLKDNLFIGGALGYNDLTADFQAGGGLDFQSISASIFGTWLYEEQGYVDALVTYGQSETETERLVRYDDAIGSVDRMAKGDADGTQLLASIGGGWDFARGALIFGPHVGFNYVEATVDKFDETGAQGANLSIPEQETRSLTGNLGMHLSYTFTPSFGVLVPNARLDWVREFEDQAETVNVRFVNDRFSQDPLDPSLPFAVQNDAPDGEYLSWSVGASAQFVNGIAAFINYRGNAMQKDITLGELTLGVRMEKAF
ncbi:MAG: autotransporter domain-containing protein, partial [Pseudomonadales bacterium]